MTIMKFPKLKKRYIVLFVFLMLTAGFVLLLPKMPQPPTSVKNIVELESYFKKITDYAIPPGISLVIIKDKQIIYSKGFGWADYPRKIASSPQTVYHWWSCTKIVTAIAILQLCENGKLQLNDPVDKYLPFFKVKYPGSTSNKVSILNLLNHSSGLPGPGFRIMSWIHHDGSPSPNQTWLVKEKLPNYSKLEFEPGDHAQYTNIGYMVLGAVIEKITSESYENYIRKNILEPLEMNETDFIYTNEMKPYEAAGSNPLHNIMTPLIPFVCPTYVREISGGTIWFERVYTDQTPSTALIGSAKDASHLLSLFMNHGEYNGKRILTEKSITVMIGDGYAKYADDDPKKFKRQGIGWQVYMENKRTLLQHTGGGLGFATIIRLYPKENLGFVLFCNDVNCNVTRILNFVEKLNW